jgi:CBS-domain-containing membrane protein
VFAAICLTAWLCEILHGKELAGLMLIGSFGATAAMIFGLPFSPYAQPRNVIGGHLVAAVCGVTARELAGGLPWLACGLAVACAVYLMHKTRCFHPPGGATALIAVIGGREVCALGYSYALMPVGAGMLFMVLLGTVINNLLPGRRYPMYWW